MRGEKPALPHHSSGIQWKREQSEVHKRKVRERQDLEIAIERVVEAGGWGWGRKGLRLD